MKISTVLKRNLRVRRFAGLVNRQETPGGKEAMVPIYSAILFCPLKYSI
jgi:hypothetical protein